MPIKHPDGEASGGPLRTPGSAACNQDLSRAAGRAAGPGPPPGRHGQGGRGRSRQAGGGAAGRAAAGGGPGGGGEEAAGGAAAAQLAGGLDPRQRGRGGGCRRRAGAGAPWGRAGEEGASAGQHAVEPVGRARRGGAGHVVQPAEAGGQAAGVPGAAEGALRCRAARAPRERNAPPGRGPRPAAAQTRPGRPPVRRPAKAGRPRSALPERTDHRPLRNRRTDSLPPPSPIPS